LCEGWTDFRPDLSVGLLCRTHCIYIVIASHRVGA
jgi:hypothetical protein